MNEISDGKDHSPERKSASLAQITGDLEKVLNHAILSIWTEFFYMWYQKQVILQMDQVILHVVPRDRADGADVHFSHKPRGKPFVDPSQKNAVCYS